MDHTFGDDTLESIQTWINKHKHATPGQKVAVDNIVMAGEDDE